MNLTFVFFIMLAAHALFDFPLQGEATAVNKDPNNYTELQAEVPWYYWMTSHALCHGGAVALITHSFWLGVAETVSHFYIDYIKCEKIISIHTDQALHIGCKLMWIGLISYFGG